MSAHLKKIATNARRLCDDARLLLDAERYPTAMALAILSLEEFGKYFKLRWEKMDGLNERRRGAVIPHKERQQVGASFFLADVALIAVAKFADDYGIAGETPGKKAENLVLTLERYKRQTSDPELAHKAKQVWENLVEHVASAMGGSLASHLNRDAALGEIQNAKHRGLYVDLDDDGNIVRSPDTVSEDEARSWVDRAETALKWLRENEAASATSEGGQEGI